MPMLQKQPDRSLIPYLAAILFTKPKGKIELEADGSPCHDSLSERRRFEARLIVPVLRICLKPAYCCFEIF
jgi:hypothetical protein